MATYEFRCPVHGSGTASYPIGTAPPQVDCGTCGEPAPRIFSPPRLSLAGPRSRAIAGAIEHAEKTADRPDIVTSLPSAARQPRRSRQPANPNWAKLPRP